MSKLTYGTIGTVRLPLLPMTTNPSKNAGLQMPPASELNHWLSVALSSLKATVRPRVTFECLGAAAGVSDRTAKRKLAGVGDRDKISTAELYGFAMALGTTPDAVYKEAARLWRVEQADTLEDEARRAMSPEEWAEVQEARGTKAVKPTRRTKRKGA